MRYRYKTKHSESEDYIVYRKFHYTPRQRGIRGFLATTCAAITVFLLTPLPDEIFIIPPIAKFWQSFLQIQFDIATLYAYATYKGIGILFLILTLLFGVQYLKDAVNSKVKHLKTAHREINNHVRKVHETIKKHTEPKPQFYYKVVARKK